MHYNRDTFTYGTEIEWGDIRRKIVIPEHLGSWEYSETDIVNIHPPYRYIACDPLGEEPPMGGEINTKPTKTWEEQVNRVLDIKDFFIRCGDNPSINCISNTHVHIHIPGLIDDISALKHLIAYIKNNQHDVIKYCHKFVDVDSMKSCKGAKMYMKFDGGRPMPNFMCDNIINMAHDFASFIRLHAAGKDGVSMGRPFRYAINTYCLKHTKTIEFRCFRCTMEQQELESMFYFVTEFMDAALNDGPSVIDILAMRDYKFPPFRWDVDECMGWINTKYSKDRGAKHREYHDVV